MKVAVYILTGNGGAKLTCPAMATGAHECGEEVTLFTDTDYNPAHPGDFDVAVLWGFVTSCQDIFLGYLKAGKKVVYLDMAYWQRHTHYKVTVNDRHPNPVQLRTQVLPQSRLKELGITVNPYWLINPNGFILVAGMGPKSAWAEKEEPVESWERRVVEYIRSQTDRRIVYRPKPSQNYGKPIPGTEMRAGNLFNDLLDSYAVVSHHGNVAVEALVAGVPAFVIKGAAVAIGNQLHLHDINSPYYPSRQEVLQWASNLAYYQWSLEEMRTGMCWRHLKDTGLI